MPGSVTRASLAHRVFARQGGAQLADGGNVAGHHLGHVFLAVALRQVELAQPLGLVAVDVVDIAVGLHRPAEHAEHRELAHERVGRRFEHHRGSRTRAVGRHVVVAGGLRAVGRRRQKVAHHLYQLVHSNVLRRGGDQDGNEVAANNGFAGAGGHLCGGDVFPFQVLVSQFVVRFRHRFDEAFAGRVEIADDAGGHVGGRIDHADQAGEVLGLTDGQLERYAAGPEYVLQLLDAALKTGVFPVHLVQHEGYRQAPLLGHVPSPFGADVNARGSGHHYHSGLDHPDRGDGFPEELVISRGVQHVDLAVAVIQPHQAHLDAGRPPIFLRFVV